MVIVAIPLHRFPACFANDILKRFDGLFLGCLGTGHVENFLLHDRAVKIVDPVTERELRERQPHRNPVGGDMVEIVEIETADGEIAQLLDC